MSDMSRFVGRSGEKRFSSLCSDEGVTCNPSDEDDHGWDHVVQFPHKSQAGVPADLQRSLPPVFVQTKTQTPESPSVRMKLSNALALARSPNPCFVVVPPPKNGDERRWRVVHFWEQMIGQTLKRARQATSAGTLEELFHKRWVSFKLTDADWQDGDKLLNWIERTVGEVGIDYASAKTSLLNSVGFEPERFVGTIQFAPLQSIEDLIDHQLGLTDTMPLGNFELRDRRFGVEVKLPIPTGPGMVGTLHAHPKECRLCLRGPDDAEIELKCDFIVGSLPGLPIEQCKFRVKGEFVDFVMSGSGDARFNLRYNTADKRSPLELEKLVRLLSWAGKGAIDVQILIDDQRLIGGTADIDPRSEQEGYYRLALLVSSLVSLSSNVRVSVPAVSIDDLIAAENQLVSLYGFLTTPDMNVAARIDSDAAPVEVEQVLTYGFAEIGDWRFGALTQWTIAEQSFEMDLWRLKFVDRRIAGRYAFQVADAAALSAFDADFKRMASVPGVLVMDDNAVARLGQQP